MSRKVKRTFLWILVLAVLAAGGYGLYVRLRPASTGELRYETAAVTRGPISARVTATGTLSPLVTVKVGSQVSGRIQEILADFNTEVKKGQVIARIDPRLFETEVKQARARLTVASASVKQAEAELAEARRRHERTTALAQRDVVAQAEADTALAAFQSAQAKVASAQASLAQARAALEQTETNVALTTIVSPIDGLVISRDVDVGQTVAASLQAPTLFTIAEDLRKMEVHTNVAESDVGRLRPGMDVEFTVDAYPTEPFQGTVKEVRFSPQTVQNVVTYDAVVSVDNGELKLRPGMTADVTFLVEERDDALMVPSTALRFRPPGQGTEGGTPGARTAGGMPGGGGPGVPGGGAPGGGRSMRQRPDTTSAATPAGEGKAGEGNAGKGKAGKGARRQVWKLGQGSKPEAVRVRIGISDGRNTEILDGLAEGDQVITGIAGAEAENGRQQQGRRGFGRFL